MEATDLTDYYWGAIERLVRKEFEVRESGWTLAKLKILEMQIKKYNHLRDSSYVELHK